MALLGGTERAECLGYGHPQVPRAGQGSKSAGPVMGVGDVGGVPAPALGEIVAELRQVRRELVRIKRRGRARGHMLNREPGGEDCAAGQRARVPAGVDGDAVAQAGQRLRERGYARGLSVCSGICESAAVVCDEGDPHHEPPPC